MRVFLSWSGNRSKQAARELHQWLRTLLPGVEIWMSEALPPGGRWSVSLQEALNRSDFGVVCVTPDNVDSHWLLFEAGAISKKSKALVAPLLIGLQPDELPPPLQQFQAVTSDYAGLYALCKELNSRMIDGRIEEKTLEKRFSKSYGAIEAALAKLGNRNDGAVGATRKRYASLVEFISGLERISKALSDRRFQADVAIGGGRSGAVLAGILATNLAIPHVISLDRVAKPNLNNELYYDFGGLVSLLHAPNPAPKVLFCSMLSETGDTLNVTRRLLESLGWPHEPGKGFEATAMYASYSVRSRYPYFIIGVDGHHGVEALANLPFMFEAYDFGTPREVRIW